MARYEPTEEMLRPAIAERTGTDLDTAISPCSWLPRQSHRSRLALHLLQS